MRKPIRIGIVTAALVAMLGGAGVSASAGTLTWECSTDGGETWETFVVAPTTARHGLNTAKNVTAKATAVLGEICRVTGSVREIAARRSRSSCFGGRRYHPKRPGRPSAVRASPP
jgi:hypothetical protein